MKFKEFSYKIDCDGRGKFWGNCPIILDNEWEQIMFALQQFGTLSLPYEFFLEFTIYNDSDLVLLNILDDDDKLIKLIEYHSDCNLIRELFETLDKGTEKPNWQENNNILTVIDGMTWEVRLEDEYGEIYRIKEPGNNIMYKKKISNLVNKIVPKINGNHNAFHLFDR